ncbi:MAG TPA: iron-sulfur cluster carrier protein ApbC [Vicinamibacterales bacterium]
MSDTQDRDAVLNALKAVSDPDLQRDIVSLGFVTAAGIDNGRVSATIQLSTPACPALELIRDQATAALRALPGVTDVAIEMTAKVRSATAPVKGQPPLPGVKNVIAVGAGKGGVGKTTVSVNLALALAQMGAKVGVLDGDIYGPNVPIMFGLSTQLVTDGKQIVPAEKYGVQVVSIGFLTKDDDAIIWRGPMLHGAIQQFFKEVAWRDLDYLIIDMPPGTGDVALSLSQTVPVVGAVVVTTPQKVSLSDSRRAIKMYTKLNVPTLGVVENMSFYACPNCHHEADIFGYGGGEGLATEQHVPFLGRLPLYQPIREGGDSGVPIVVSEPGSVAAKAFRSLAQRTAKQVAVAAQLAVDANKGKIPLIQVR